MRAIVVGGGWSGLAAAVELVHRGIPVTVVEAAGRLGGRAGRVPYRGRNYDTGQHLLLGAYHGILHLLDVMGIPEHMVFERRPFELISKSARPGSDIRLRLAALPAPFHLLGGLLTARGLSGAEKWSAVRFCLAAARSKELHADYSVQELLYRHDQSPRLIARLWEPISLAALNTPLHEASAEIFLRVLRDAFSYQRRDSDLLLARRGLGAVLPVPARRFIERHGGRIVLNRRATAIELHAGRAAGVTLADGTRLHADHVVLALPPTACLDLIDGVAPLRPLVARLQQFEFAPICTFYLQYPAAVRLEFPMVGLHGTLAQWLFDLGSAGRPGLMAAVISGPGPHMELERDILRERVVAELAACFPAWPAPEPAFALCEKRATFLSRVAINALRPGVETSLPGCWLAGDAVATGYSSTLEGAVSSGMECARRITRAR